MIRDSEPTDTPATPDPASEELLRDGALTVRVAEEFSGLSRNELWVRMNDGTLRWFWHNQRRLIVRRDLVRYLVGLYEANPGARSRKSSPNPHAKPPKPRRVS